MKQNYIGNWSQEAVQKALISDWKSSVEINNRILKELPDDIDALNRLARAYFELGKIQKAKAISKNVLRIDPFNTIAKKPLEKWSIIKKVNGSSCVNKLKPDTFLEEPGKTKIVSLINTGDRRTIIRLDSGDEIRISVRGHRVIACTKEGKYLGKFPDDLSARLRTFTNLGNVYRASIKSIGNNDIKIFIREVSKSTKCADIPSFSSEKIDYISFTPPELVHKKADEEISEVEDASSDIEVPESEN